MGKIHLIEALWTTIEFSLAATALTLVVSFGLAQIMNTCGVSSRLLAVFELFWMLPGTLIALTILELRSGLEGFGVEIYPGMGLMIYGAVWSAAPYWASRWVGVLREVPVELREWAKTANLSQFWHLECPAVRARLPSAVALLVLWSSTAFSLVYFLGGGPPIETLETRAVVQFMGVGGTLREAILMMGLLLLWMMPFFAVQPSMIWKGSSGGRRADVRTQSAFSHSEWVGVGLILVWILPLVLILVRGFSILPRTLRENGAEVMAAVGETLLDVVGLVGVGSVVVTLGLMRLLEMPARRAVKLDRRLDWFLWIPIIVWALAWSRVAQAGWMSLRMGRWAVWVLPWSVLSVRLILAGQTLDLKSLLEWGESAGLRRAERFCWIVWPSLRSAIAIQLVWMGVWAMTDSVTNLLLMDPERPNLMALQIDWLSRYRIQEAQSITSLWIVCVLGVIWKTTRRQARTS